MSHLSDRQFPTYILALLLIVCVAVGATILWKRRVFPEPTTTDVTDKPSQRGAVLPGATYMLPRNAYVAQEKGTYFIELAYAVQETPGASLPRPKSRLEYEANPAKWPHIVCFPARDLTLRVEKIYRFSSHTMDVISIVGSATCENRTFNSVKWMDPKLGEPIR